MGRVERLASKQEKNMCNSSLRKELSSPVHEDTEIKEKRKPVTAGARGGCPRGRSEQDVDGSHRFPPGHGRGLWMLQVTLHGRESGPHPCHPDPNLSPPAKTTELSHSGRSFSCSSNPGLALASFIPSRIIQLIPWSHKKHLWPSHWMLPRPQVACPRTATSSLKTNCLSDSRTLLGWALAIQCSK